MVDLSICIPTFNRVYYLNNCLNSIKLANKNSDLKVEVCISDNCSSENVEHIVEKYKDDLNLTFNKNEQNLGMGQNILKSVSMAKGNFCWLLGNDDIVLSDTFEKFKILMRKDNNIDFFYVNSYHLDILYLKKFDYPINPKNINFKDMKKFSNYTNSKKMNFFELFDPKVSYEFMLSMFLCIFRRKIWIEGLDAIDMTKVSENSQYSNLHNTAPHSLVWARGFKEKTAYFSSDPLTANIHGPRSEDWGNLYPFVEGIRIPQILDNLKKEGMSFFQYVKCKNFALRRLIPSFFYMIKNKESSNLEYVNIKKDFFYNLIFPMVYISLIKLILKKIFKNIKSFLKLN